MLNERTQDGNGLERKAQTEQSILTLNYAPNVPENKKPYSKKVKLTIAAAAIPLLTYGGCRLYQALEPLWNLSVDVPIGL